MYFRKFKSNKKYVVFLVVLLAALPVIAAFTIRADHSVTSDHRVQIAFGFHVNLYHSFRNDTNDESGFGKDIRIIRNTIRTLDRHNQKGIPVKGVWDFDNLFSLQELLPQYAPDIISDIQRRVRENGDEVILMSYNNGLVSAMTPEELDKAVAWSISNPWQSGVKDMFGRYAPIVRPQEMMTTPGNFAVYREHGIQAVALYYSATPFDAFRIFSRPLSRAEAHNPLRYRNETTREEMMVLPTYHFGDLIEHVSLKHWAEELRGLQNRGALDHDALIFINFDADSELWEGVDLPRPLQWLPNTGGLDALIREVCRLPFVDFTTPGAYLAQHDTLGTISFGQDTADGSFDGYNSWAEKAGASRYWTVIQRNRRVCSAVRKALLQLHGDVDAQRLEALAAFAEMKRLRALSTTNFGMATPFLARQREQVAADLIHAIEYDSQQMEQLMAKALNAHLKRRPLPQKAHNGRVPLDTLLILSSRDRERGRGSRFINIPLPAGYREGLPLTLVRADGKVIPAVNLGVKKVPADHFRLSLYISDPDALTDGIYQLCAATDNNSPPTGRTGELKKEISNGRLSVHFEKGKIEGIYLDGIRQVEAGSFTPYLKWGGTPYRAGARLSAPPRGTGAQAASFQMAGPIPGPLHHTVSGGWMDYCFTLVDNAPYLLLQGKIQYPSTVKDDFLKAGTPGLIRRIDANWQEAAPAEIRFSPRTGPKDPIRVLKRNYLGISSEYALDYFRHSDRNFNLDNINNHITDSYVGVAAGNRTMAVAMDTSVQANFAFAPLKMRFDENSGLLSVTANPFGTYTGRQYVPFTWGNRNGFDATLLAGEQFAGAGPTYNGTEQAFSVMVAFFNGRHLPETIQRDLLDFAHPPLVISTAGISIKPPVSSPPPAPSGLVAAYKEGVVQFSWDSNAASRNHYRIFCGSRPGQYEAVYPAVGNSLEVKHFNEDLPFGKGQHYFAAIERIGANGNASRRSAEIRFAISESEKKFPKIPLILGAKIIWANLSAFLSSLFA